MTNEDLDFLAGLGELTRRGIQCDDRENAGELFRLDWIEEGTR